MADPILESEVAQVSDVRPMAEGAREASSAMIDLHGNVTILKQKLDALSPEALRELGPIAKTLEKNIAVASRGVGKFGSSMRSLRGGPGLQTLSLLQDGFDSIGGKAIIAGKKMADSFLGSNNQIRRSIDRLIGPGSTLFGQTALVAGLDTFDRKFGRVFSKIQKPMMDVEKLSMQMSLGMGRSFSGAADNAASFRDQMTGSILDTKTDMEDIMKTQSAFRDAFSAEEVTLGLDSLAKAADNVRGRVSLTNVALLVSAAKGMESTKVAEMMAKAHTELGADLNQSATMLGEIALAAEKSGLSFNKVSESVMKSADNLKMWGGTVGAVTPMYNAFSRALGEGRKGLAPELMEQYVSGIADMQFEMKALIGLQAGAGGVGAIGAGLQQEALLEQGPEGMAEASDRLIETIKRFSGGEMITRQEAIADPALERNFMIQRQLLKQMVGGTDKSATQMMTILKDIDQHGMQVGGDAEAKLGELMGQGERVQEKTTDVLKDQTQILQATQLKAADRIVREISSLSSTFAKGAPAAVRKVQRRVARTGTAEMADLKNIIGGLSSSMAVTKTMTDIGATGSRGRAQVRGGVAQGQSDVFSIINKLQESMMRTAASKSVSGRGVIKTELVNDDISVALNEVGDKISALVNKGDLDTREQGQLNIYRQAEDMIKAMSSSNRVSMKGVELPQGQIRDANARVERPTLPQTQGAWQRQGSGVGENIIEIPAATRARNVVDKAEQTVRLRSANEPVTVAPTQRSIQAVQEARREKVNLDISTTPEAIETDVMFNIKSDKQTLTIEIEEERVKKIVREVVNENR